MHNLKYLNWKIKGLENTQSFLLACMGMNWPENGLGISLQGIESL